MGILGKRKVAQFASADKPAPHGDVLHPVRVKAEAPSLDPDAGLVVSGPSAVRQFDSKSSQLSDNSPNFIYVDFNAVDFDGDTPVQGYQSRRLNIRGDWLFVDPVSTGGCLADLFSRQRNAWLPSVSLSAGAIIETPFNALAIFYNPMNYSGAKVQPGVLGEFVPYQAPGLKIWYGMGKCPFQTVTEPRGAANLPSAVVSNVNPGQWSCSFVLTDTSIVRQAAMGATKVPVGAETSRPIALAKFQTVQGEDLGWAMPTSVQIGGALGVAAAPITIWCGWQDVRVPKYAAYLFMAMVELGNATTNNFTNTFQSVHLG